MQFSDSTDKLGLIQMCEDLTGIGDGNITGTDLKRFTRWINQWNRRVWYWIFDSYGGWQFDDSNQTDLPAAVDTLTADQTSYSLPSEAITVRGVEVKTAGGVWQRLQPVTEEMIRERQAMGEFFNTSGQPSFYQLVGTTVRIFPASNYTQASSFKVFFDRDIVNFASTDTTQTPGFVSTFHEVLALGGALEYLKIFQPGDARTAQIRTDLTEYEKSIKGFYQQQWRNMYPPRIRVRDSLREFM